MLLTAAGLHEREVGVMGSIPIGARSSESTACLEAQPQADPGRDR